MSTSSTAGSDYSSTVMELKFNAAVNRHVVRIPITQDNITEIDERFRAHLILVEDNGINVQVTPDQAMVTIMDYNCESTVNNVLLFHVTSLLGYIVDFLLLIYHPLILL